MDEASAKSGAVLTRQIAQSGLREADFGRLPAGPRKLHGAHELGWSVQGEGRLENVINLLFVLQESPYLHRLENLTVIPGDLPGLVKVRFRYLTLVVDPAPIVELAELPPVFSLNSPERRMLDSIVSRDILRPYVKRPPEIAAGSGAGPPARPSRRFAPGTGIPSGRLAFRVARPARGACARSGRPKPCASNRGSLRRRRGGNGGLPVPADARQ
ncbi:MAG: hypothetical protein MZV64_71030 [Ignavibacteriales bacterium]|nr:hypothetical protein [Ignavibacteriales bacterium]